MPERCFSGGYPISEAISEARFTWSTTTYYYYFFSLRR